MVCVCMSASPSLSHSSQVKEYNQKYIKRNEEVSDECSSGVMRVGHVDHSIPGVCVLCVQRIAGLQRELLDPSTTSERRSMLEGYKELREKNERSLDREREALQVLLPPSKSKWLISGN